MHRSLRNSLVLKRDNADKLRTAGMVPPATLCLLQALQVEQSSAGNHPSAQNNLSVAPEGESQGRDAQRPAVSSSWFQGKEAPRYSSPQATASEQKKQRLKITAYTTNAATISTATSSTLPGPPQQQTALRMSGAKRLREQTMAP